MNARAFVVFGASVLTLILANTALADGAYQRTDDRKKTLVWNNDPQPGDIASWSGDRDADGYANGVGTLSWYKTEKTLLTGSNIFFRKKVPASQYSGNMVHGKFDGAVVTVDHGKTYHATFTDGHRKGRWAAGPVPAAAEIADTKPAEPIQERTEAASAEDQFRPGERASEDVLVETPSAQATERPIKGTAKESSESAEPEAPAEGPENAEDRDRRTEVSKSTTQKPSEQGERIAKNTEASSEESSTDEPEQSASPRAPVTKRAALAPGAVRAIEQPGRVAKKSESEPARQTKPAKPERVSSEQKEEEPPKVAKTEPEKTKEQAESPAEGPLSAESEKTQTPKSKSAITEPPKPSTQETPVDDSIKTLTGPPTSLHANPPADTKTAQEISAPPVTAVSPPTQAAPKLTAIEAMDASDIEARTRGYDLGEYQLPKAEFNAANGTWSVTYLRKDADKSGKQLSVTIQDKNGKAEVRK